MLNNNIHSKNIVVIHIYELVKITGLILVTTFLLYIMNIAQKTAETKTSKPPITISLISLFKVGLNITAKPKTVNMINIT